MRLGGNEHMLFEDSKEGLRINKFLCMYANISRRQADKLIQQGKVRINNRIAAHGELVTPEDKIFLFNNLITPRKIIYRYILLNKPVGYICSKVGDKTVFELLEREREGLNYVGRLDVNTSGALLFTNDGVMANCLMKSNVSRLYEVLLDAPLSSDAVELLKQGPSLDGEIVKLGKVKIYKREIEIELFEGRQREVRRILESLGSKVIKLNRISFAGISINTLPVSKYRKLSSSEIRELIKLKKIEVKSIR